MSAGFWAWASTEQVIKNQKQTHVTFYPTNNNKYILIKFDWVSNNVQHQDSGEPARVAAGLTAGQEMTVNVTSHTQF